jgi:predicted transglutaminase-like cysteine proteinase
MLSGKRGIYTIAVMAAMLFGTVIIGAAPARAEAVDFIGAGDAADAPLGFIAMCLRDADLCSGRVPDAGTAPRANDVPRTVGMPLAYGAFGTASIDRAKPGRRARHERAAPVIRYDAKNPMLSVKALNKQVNRQIVQVSDLTSTGYEERWDRPGRVGRPAGDCEDIAIEKRMRLIEAGFPPEKLFYAIVYRPNFGLHTILIARLDGGDYVLDSATPRLVKWTQARYVWLRIQSPDDPLRWNVVASSPASAQI